MTLYEPILFARQFAGLICFQNSAPAPEYGGKAPGATIHRCFPTEQVARGRPYSTLSRIIAWRAVRWTTVGQTIR
jgi:hypothetical protein